MARIRKVKEKDLNIFIGNAILTKKHNVFLWANYYDGGVYLLKHADYWGSKANTKIYPADKIFNEAEIKRIEKDIKKRRRS